MSYVYQDKKRCQFFSVKDVTVDQPLKGGPLVLAAGRISVAWKIHKIPSAVIHPEMIDEQSLARSLRGLGHLLAPAQHVDKRRLAYVRPPDKSILRNSGDRTLPHIGTAYLIFGILYIHIIHYH